VILITFLTPSVKIGFLIAQGWGMEKAGGSLRGSHGIHGRAVFPVSWEEWVHLPGDTFEAAETERVFRSVGDVPVEIRET